MKKTARILTATSADQLQDELNDFLGYINTAINNIAIEFSTAPLPAGGVRYTAFVVYGPE